MTAQPKGKLIIIGGHEDKEGDQVILQEVVKMAEGGKLVVITVATEEPEAVADEYRQVFRELDCRGIEVIDIRDREEAHDPARIDRLDGARVIFFTGGDQLRISSQIGGSPFFERMQALHQDGAAIVGTSAGAAAMPTTMLVSGTSDKSGDLSALGMVPGLGLLPGVVIDSHFAERGRIGRLLGAVAQNPTHLGIGIDEDTAIIVDRRQRFKVIGSGAVYVINGETLTYSSLSDDMSEGVISLFDVCLHILGDGDRFDLKARRPEAGKRQ